MTPRTLVSSTMISRTALAAGFALCAAMLSTPAFADAKLAQDKNCMACHAAAKKMVGPSYADVAEKYAKDKDAVAKLAEKIVKGSSGTWGAVPMPANAQVSAAEAKTLAEWVMTTKK
jgi:cytochrome c